jgi:integrase
MQTRQPDPPRSWKWHFDRLIMSYAGLKFRKLVDGRSPTASNRTREYHRETAMLLVRVLREELGFKISRPHNLAPRHMEAWATWMNKQFDTGARASATLSGYASTVRLLVRATGQPGLIDVFERYLKPQTTARNLVADVDKTWEAHGLDVEEVVIRAWHSEHWVSMALLFQYTFGTRRREATMCSPLRDFDLDARLVHVVGAKGDRPRVVPIRTEDEYQVCVYLMDYTRWRNLSYGLPLNAETSLGPPDLELGQALARYTDLASELGLTREDNEVVPHGLRAGFVCRVLEDFGIKPVVKGGSGRHPDPALDQLYRRLVSEYLGHTRPQPVGAYGGAPAVEDRVAARTFLSGNGLLLPEKDAWAAEMNRRRITAFLKYCRKERIPTEKLPHNLADTANGQIQLPPFGAQSQPS